MTLLQRLGVTHPIIQAPMAGTSTPAMAAAVSNAGALGFLGLGSSNAGKRRRADRGDEAADQPRLRPQFLLP